MHSTLIHRHLRNALLNWLPMILWMVLIYWLSSQPKLPHPGRKVGVSDYLFDYSAHVFIFGLLTWLAWRAIEAKPTVLPDSVVSFSRASAAGFCALYAVSDEIHQRFVPGRWSNLADWLADIAGILITVSLLAGWQKWRNRRSRS